MISHLSLSLSTVPVGCFVGCVTVFFFFFSPLSESRLHAQEDIRGPLSELQQLVLPEIQDQIQDYRYRKGKSKGFTKRAVIG